MTHRDDSDTITVREALANGSMEYTDTVSPSKKLNIVEMVREFHEVFGHPAPGNLDLQLGDDMLRVLRAELIREEFVDELLPALGLEINAATGKLVVTGKPVDVAETADALTDILWVTIGAMLAFGMDPVKLMAEVHRANMSKLGEDGKPVYREDGKIMKGPNYSVPDIKKVLGLL